MFNFKPKSQESVEIYNHRPTYHYNSVDGKYSFPTTHSFGRFDPTFNACYFIDEQEVSKDDFFEAIKPEEEKLEKVCLENKAEFCEVFTDRMMDFWGIRIVRVSESDWATLTPMYKITIRSSFHLGQLEAEVVRYVSKEKLNEFARKCKMKAFK